MGNSKYELMDKIGRYQVEHELGRGAMGVVYRAFDPAIGRRIAIKTIRLNELSDAGSLQAHRERLLREAQSAGMLSHPNIVTIYDISEEEATAYIFMEYVEGKTLDSVARGMSIPELLSLLEQTAEALDYAHVKGIVHRDIKPANLMLAGSQVKITDFGVARLADRDATNSGTLLGTPSYMSPEQVAGGEVSGAADQYALGVVAYEFLAGGKPFESDNLANLFFRITQQAPPDVASLSPPVNAVLRKVLSKKPEDRYSNCLSFVATLSQALGTQVEAMTPARAPSGDEPTIATITHAPEIVLPELRLPPPQPPSRWKPILITLLGASILSGLIWFRYGRDDDAPVPTNSDAVTDGAPKPSEAGERPEPKTVPPAETGPSEKPAETRSQQPEQTEAVHPVAFTSLPEGAEILVNDGKQDRCPKTPCTLELPPGSFKVTAKLAGFTDSTRTIRVPDQLDLHSILEKPLGTIMINSTPSGARVRIDGKDTGEKTPAMLKLEPGKYRLEVIKEGLPSQSQEVTVRNGVVQTLTVNWNP